jgi:hypothetical protein
MPLIFGADLWQRPEGYEPPAIHHDDPLVMDIAKTIMSASPEGYDWDDQMRGARQGETYGQRGEYYAHPYRQTIQDHIQMAVAVRKLFP